MKKQILLACIATATMAATSNNVMAQAWVPSSGNLITDNHVANVYVNTNNGLTPNAMIINSNGQVSIGSSITPYSNFSLSLENSIYMHNTSTGTFKYIYATGGTTGLDMRTDGNAIVMHDATEPTSANHIEFNSWGPSKDKISLSFTTNDGSTHNAMLAYNNGDVTFGDNVVINGTLTVISDAAFKKNITNLNSIKEQLFQVTPHQYQMNKAQFPTYGFNDKTHFGFIAQEVQKVYPNLVNVVDSNNHLGVNYIEFIPLLLQALKEEDAEVQTLKNTITDLQNKVNALSQGQTTGLNNVTDNSASKSTLSQNVPNPFNASTTIGFNIVDKYNVAYIGIYDMNGKEISRYNIQPGATQIVVPGGQLQPGMYIYSLVVDGGVVDTKRMVASH